MPKITPFFDLFASQFEDQSVFYLIIAATVFFILNIWTNSYEQSGYLKSLTIYAGVFFAAFLSALCDYIKES